jgi:hypothetical protein
MLVDADVSEKHTVSISMFLRKVGIDQRINTASKLENLKKTIIIAVRTLNLIC